MPTLAECLGRVKVPGKLKTYIKRASRNSDPLSVIDGYLEQSRVNRQSLHKTLSSLQTHRRDVRKAIAEKRPVSVEAADAYGLTPPDWMVEELLYVPPQGKSILQSIQPAATRNPEAPNAGQSPETVTSPQVDSTVEPDTATEETAAVPKTGILKRKVEEANQAVTDAPEAVANRKPLPEAIADKVLDLDEMEAKEAAANAEYDLKQAGITLKKTKKGWTAKGIPKEVADGLKQDYQGRNTRGGYFFRSDPTEGLVDAAKEIAEEAEQTAAAEASGLVRTRIGDLSPEQAEFYEKAREERLKLAREPIEQKLNAIDALLSQFMAGNSRGQFALALRRADDADSVSRFDEMVQYSQDHPELGLPQEEGELLELLKNRPQIDEESLLDEIDNELAEQIDSWIEQQAEEEGFPWEREEAKAAPKQTAIPGTEEAVASAERSEKAKRSKGQFENVKGKQGTFISGLGKDLPGQTVMFDDMDGLKDTPPTIKQRAKKARKSDTSQLAIDDTKQTFSALRKNDAEPVSNADIMKTWERDFDVPIRRGKVPNGGKGTKVQGIYKHLVEVVRLRNSEDVNLRVASHEVAHHVDEKTDAVKSMSQATKDVFGKLDYDDLLNRPGEGFAEFVSRYVMGEDVKLTYPEAYQWFETQWAPAHPEMAAKVGKAARFAQQYANQGAFARAKMLVPGRPPAPVDRQAEDYKKAMQSFWNRSVAALVDQNRAFYLLDEAYKKAGGKFHNREATYDLKLATDYTAPAHAERAMLEGVHTVSQQHKILGPSISEALKDIKSYDDYDRAQAYAIALFTVEMADAKPGYNTGMRLDDAEFIIAEVEKNADELKRYNHFAETLTAFNNALVEMQFDAGGTTARDRNYILGKTKHYVPLHREVGGKRAKRGMMAGAGMANLPPAFRRRTAEGSGLPVVDIVEASMRRAMDQYKRALTQQVVHSVVTTVDPKLNGGVKGLGKLAERLPPTMVSQSLNINEALNDLVDEGLIDEDTAKEVKIVSTLREGKVPNAKNLKWIAERYGVEVDSDTVLDDLLEATDEVADGAGLITFWRPSYLPNHGKNIVRLVVNGEPQLYQLDEILYDAMTSMGQLELGAFGEAVKSFNHAFKTGAVGLSTGFGGANVVRDWWDAQAHSVNQGAESTYMPFVMLGKYAYAEVESLRSGGKAANEFVRLFKEYGGELTTRLGYDTKSQRSEKRKLFGGADATSYLLDHPIQSIVSVPGKGLKTAERIITMTDVGPRLAEFVAVMKRHGYSLNDKGQIVNKHGDVTRPPRRVIVAAINAAGDATVNFKRVGRTMRKIDAYIPFTNAALQSRVRQVMAYKALGNGMSDVQAQRVAIMTLAFGALGAAAFFAYRDDDDNEERAEWLKGSHFVLFNGTVRVPKSRDYRFITNMVEAIMEDTIGGKEGKAKEQAIEEAKELMFGGGGVLREAFEQTSNYDQFREAPIESQYDARLHPWARYDDHTSLPAKHLGNITGHLIGISPKRIDHLLDSTTGGMYRRLNRTGEHLLNGELGPKDIPVVNAFWMDKDYQQSLGDFYDAKWEAEKDVNTAKKEDQDSTDAKAKSKMFDDYESLMTDLRDAEGEEPTGENEKYVIGLARAALNREPLDNYPNPLLADVEDLPPEARPVVQKYLDELWQTGFGTTKAGKPYGQPIPGPTDTHETYRDRYGKWVAKRKEAQEEWNKRQGILKRVSK